MSSDAVLVIVGLCALAIIVAWVAISLFRLHVRTRFRRRMNVAQVAEGDAEDLLRSHGYRVVERQVRVVWPLCVNGEQIACESRADVIVERDGQRFVGEIKSGTVAPVASHPATRRQLLEYSLLFGCSEVLLIDVPKQAINTVRFDALMPS